MGHVAVSYGLGVGVCTSTVTFTVANQPFGDLDAAHLDATEDELARRCCTLMDLPELVRTHTTFHWWLDACSTIP